MPTEVFATCILNIMNALLEILYECYIDYTRDERKPLTWQVWRMLSFCFRYREAESILYFTYDFDILLCKPFLGYEYTFQMLSLHSELSYIVWYRR